MKKRTVWFGNPIIVLRGAVVSGLFFAVFFVGAWELFVYLLGVDLVKDFLVDRMWLVVVMPIVYVFGGMGLGMFVASRVGDPMVRLRELKGRMCLGCGYEIGEELNECSECGARWSLDDLNRFWRWFATVKQR
jgi:hypothetical protein